MLSSIQVCEEIPIIHHVYPPMKKNHIIIVFSFSWDDCTTQEKYTMVMQNIRGKPSVLWAI